MDTIPVEIYSFIGSFLDNASKRKMRLASTLWFNIIKYDSFDFYYTTEEQFEGICERMKKYKFPIGVRFYGGRLDFEKRHYDMLGQITQLTRLTEADISRQTPLEDLWGLTNLTNLELIDGGTSPAILAHLPNLKSINIRTKEHVQASKTLSKLESIIYYFNGDSVLEYIEEGLPVLPNPLKLTQLMGIGEPSEKTLNAMNEHLIKLSNLRTLAMIVNRPWNEEGLALPNSWSVPTLPNLDTLSISNLENIQSISQSNTKLTQLQLTAQVNCSIFTPLPNLVNLRLTGTLSNLSELGSLTRLKNLSLSFKNYSTELMAEMQLLSKLTNLEVFEIASFDGQRSWSESLQYFSENNNLTEILLSGAANSFGDYMARFNKLQTLSCARINLQTTNHMTALTSLSKLHGVHTMTPQKFANINTLTTLKYLQFSVGSEDAAANSDEFTELYFGKLVNLEDLNIAYDRNTDVSSVMLEGINELGHLTKLSVEWPVITKSFLEEIAQCTSLEELSIGADISDDAILALANITSLKHFKLNPKTKEFTGVNLTCLTSLRVLTVYSLNKTQYVVNSEDLKQKLPNLRSCVM